MSYIIAANWKMHKTAAETAAFCKAIMQEEQLFGDFEIIICPPYTALSTASAALKGSRIKLGAQNLHWEPKGAFTGEISAFMLGEMNVSHVIIGHSERRHLMGESDDQVHLKVQTALNNGLIPILCVGETGQERDNGMTEMVIERQLNSVLEGLSDDVASKMVIAYEPVWAIGTGRAASEQDAEDAARLIVQIIDHRLGRAAAETIRIQYGGSVTADNIGLYVTSTSLQGFLVGGASLETDLFSSLIQAAREAVKG